MLSRTPGRGRYERSMVALNRLVLAGSLLYVVGWLFFHLTGGSAARLQDLPDALDRLKRPLVWEVPQDGVRYGRYYQGMPDPGSKFVFVRVRMEARTKIGFPIVSRCFRLVDEQGVRYYPLPNSPIFLEQTDQRYLDRGDVYEGELVFQTPAERRSSNLLFDRYHE
ncbi:MAG: hypothetical protein AB1505_02415 [Candidatus Latescibacterota bacterium]